MSDWSVWTDCTVTCGGGTRFRERFCEQDRFCRGDLTESQECFDGPCVGMTDQNDYFLCLWNGSKINYNQFFLVY